LFPSGRTEGGQLRCFPALIRVSRNHQLAAGCKQEATPWGRPFVLFHANYLNSNFGERGAKNGVQVLSCRRHLAPGVRYDGQVRLRESALNDQGGDGAGLGAASAGPDLRDQGFCHKRLALNLNSNAVFIKVRGQPNEKNLQR
jgi:hypothetical protein